MSATGLEVFDTTLQKTNIWLKEIGDELGPDRQRSYQALRAVLHTVRDRLTVDQAAHLGSQLPMLVRGIYFEGWHPAANPEKVRSREEFVSAIADKMQNARPIDPEAAGRVVLAVLTRHVEPGEVDHVREALPEAIRTLWAVKKAA